VDDGAAEIEPNDGATALVPSPRSNLVTSKFHDNIYERVVTWTELLGAK